MRGLRRIVKTKEERGGAWLKARGWEGREGAKGQDWEGCEGCEGEGGREGGGEDEGERGEG